ncbi:predicted protein [Naegleria gruberi]|uniref:Predicted protein n=1 Tax=Naegleria gruberi TaxID=5762 RepID=D2VNF4_NAEGR|nr:uncharacterized protein NAEGRDRAFT_70478 [Naegleria gruberi]EFC41650.1 predicted protein [Naegleria gruberi]|eukprot:XP_002674394.1 predicted protein [Naegleria gruberi strain NEG-M]
MIKTVLITGATTGIGKATAVAFAKKGFNLVVTGRKIEKEQELVEQVKKAGANDVSFFQLDVAQETAFEQVVKKVVEKYGKLDVLVNNAGISISIDLLADSKTEDFKQMIDTNVLGVYYGMKYAIQAMLQTETKGAIVNLASIAGHNGLLYTSQYCATKHAVVGLTKGAATDYATKGIAPGAIKTEILQNAIDCGAYSEEGIAAMHPMNRMGTVEDIANGIVFLASDDCLFMTGTTLFVDGGYNCK